MPRRLTTWALIALACTAILFAVLGGAFMWRLSRGPVNLSILTGPIQRTLNANLSGLKVEIADAVIEREEETGRPRFRLREIALFGERGELIARAPRAAVEVKGGALLLGSVVPKSLELIGPRIMVRRKLSGEIELGFGEPAPADEVPADSSGPAPPAGGAVEKAPPPAPPGGGRVEAPGLLEFLKRELLADAGGARTAAASIDAVNISRATISLYDEANGSIWYGREVNLAFKRAPHGATLLAGGRIVSGREPWRFDLVVDYRRQARQFAMRAQVYDLIPADLSDEVFMLSELAEVRLPLSGHVEAEIDENGTVRRAAAEFGAGAGFVGFPKFLADPILVDEGMLRLHYDPAAGEIAIGDSAIYVGGSKAELTGKLRPVHSPAGRFSGMQIALKARNADAAGEGAGRAAPAIDRLELQAVASFEDARLDIDDLIVGAGPSGVRLRGSFYDGNETIGVRFAARARDLPAEVLMRLWPPIVAAPARRWVARNIAKGRMVDGDLQVDLEPAMVAAALRDEPIPDERVQFRFKLADVTATYADDMPPIRGASGSGLVQGDRFDLKLDSGLIPLPSGAAVAVTGGTMQVDELAKIGPLGTFRAVAAAPARALLELIDHPPLRLLAKSGLDAQRVSGDAQLTLDLSLPLAKAIPEGAVSVAARATIGNVKLKQAAEGVDIDGGSVTLEVRNDGLKGQGTVNLNGVAAKLAWTSKFAAAGAERQEFTLEADLDEKGRERLGAVVNEFIRGPVKVVVTAKSIGGRIDGAKVEADLTRAELRVDAIDWQRPPGARTTASFDLDLLPKGAYAIRNLRIDGKGVAVKGALAVTAAGELVEAQFPSLALGDVHRFGLVVRRREEGSYGVSLSGVAFDARSLIGSLFEADRAGPAPAVAQPRPTIVLEAMIDQMVAHRNEVVSRVSAQALIAAGSVQQMQLTGRFADGQSLEVQIAPASAGARQLVVTSMNSGATLRAANLYSRISGGQFWFSAELGAPGTGKVRNGRLKIKSFEVHNEPVLTQFDERGNLAKTPPRHGNERLVFNELRLPFTVDGEYVRIGDALLQGASIGASAQGSIRKGDGKLDIGGTVIPAYTLNAALSQVPLFGEMLMGGRGQGMFGMTFALKGTMGEPKVLVNPVSALAPGFLRRFFEFGGGGVDAEGNPTKRAAPQREPSSQ